MFSLRNKKNYLWSNFNTPSYLKLWKAIPELSTKPSFIRSIRITTFSPLRSSLMTGLRYQGWANGLLFQIIFSDISVDLLYFFLVFNNDSFIFIFVFVKDVDLFSASVNSVLWDELKTVHNMTNWNEGWKILSFVSLSIVFQSYWAMVGWLSKAECDDTLFKIGKNPASCRTET